MNMRYITRFIALVMGLIALPLVSKEVVTIYNNTIYQVNVELTFDCLSRDNQVNCTQTRAMPPRTSATFDFPYYRTTMAGGSKVSGNRDLRTIKATILAQQEPIWANGKVGTTVIGMKKLLEQASVTFTTGSGKGKTNEESASFVINANSRNRLVINGVERVQNLAIYRFIQ